MLEKDVSYPERIQIYACFNSKVVYGAAINIILSFTEYVPAIKPRRCFATNTVADDRTTVYRIFLVRIVHK
jgi:hypothetical protein